MKATETGVKLYELHNAYPFHALELAKALLPDPAARAYLEVEHALRLHVEALETVDSTANEVREKHTRPALEAYKAACRRFLQYAGVEDFSREARFWVLLSLDAFYPPEA